MPGLIPRAELNGVPQMFTADITAGFSKMTLSCSGALLLRIKDFNKMLYIIFNKWDLPVCPLSEIKIWTGLVLTQLCLAYSLALLFQTTWLLFQFRDHQRPWISHQSW